MARFNPPQEIKSKLVNVPDTDELYISTDAYQRYIDASLYTEDFPTGIVWLNEDGTYLPVTRVPIIRAACRCTKKFYAVVLNKEDFNAAEIRAIESVDLGETKYHSISLKSLMSEVEYTLSADYGVYFRTIPFLLEGRFIPTIKPDVEYHKVTLHFTTDQLAIIRETIEEINKNPTDDYHLLVDQENYPKYKEVIHDAKKLEDVLTDSDALVYIIANYHKNIR